MPGDYQENNKNPFVRFKQYVDNHLQRGLRQITSTKPPHHSAATSGDSSDHWREDMADSSGTSGAASQPPAVLSPEEKELGRAEVEVYRWAMHDDYSPLNLQHLPQPVCRAPARPGPSSDFLLDFFGASQFDRNSSTFKDAFEDLLATAANSGVSNGKPSQLPRDSLFDADEGDDNLLDAGFRNVIDWTSDLGRRGLWKSYFLDLPAPLASACSRSQPSSHWNGLLARSDLPTFYLAAAVTQSIEDMVRPRSHETLYFYPRWFRDFRPHFRQLGLGIDKFLTEDEKLRFLRQQSVMSHYSYYSFAPQVYGDQQRFGHSSDTQAGAEVEEDLYVKRHPEVPRPHGDGNNPPQTAATQPYQSSETMTTADGHKIVKSYQSEVRNGRLEVTQTEKRFDPQGNLIRSSEESYTRSLPSDASSTVHSSKSTSSRREWINGSESSTQADSENWDGGPGRRWDWKGTWDWGVKFGHDGRDGSRGGQSQSHNCSSESTTDPKRYPPSSNDSSEGENGKSRSSGKGWFWTK